MSSPSPAGREAGQDPATRFDPADPDFAADRFALLADIRALAPAVHLPALGVWAVTRADDVRAVLADPVRFSSAGAFASGNHLPAAAREHYDESRPIFRYAHINSDDPLHTRLRAPLVATFTPRRVRGLGADIRADAETLVGDLFGAGSPADVVDRVARPLPLRTICRLLGVPVGDASRFHRWSRAKLALQLPGLSEDAHVAAARGLAELDAYVRGFVTGATPPEPGGLIADLLESRRSGAIDLTDDELTGSLANLLFAGHETTTGTLGNAVARLATDQPTWARLAAGEIDLDAMVDEVLRLDSAVVGLFRRTTSDVVLGDVVVPRHATVWVSYGAANRDPARFPRPDHLDVGRTNARQHLGFGHGRHVCVGAALARAQLRETLDALARHHPDARLVRPVREHAHHTVRGPVEVVLSRDPA